jgi:hypothetical protein
MVTNIAGSILSSNGLLSILTAAPGQFQSIALQPDSSLQIVLWGDPGATYYVQSSTNLVNWSPLTNLTLSTGAAMFSLPVLPGDTQRYFRARSGP